MKMWNFYHHSFILGGICWNIHVEWNTTQLIYNNIDESQKGNVEQKKLVQKMQMMWSLIYKGGVGGLGNENGDNCTWTTIKKFK